MSQLSIRHAVEADTEVLLQFIRELAIYQKSGDAVLATETMIKESIFAKDSHVSALICEDNGQAIGSAIYFFNYSTWLAKPGLYLEDLYVTPEQRGNGAGKLLLKNLAQIALEKGCGRVEWACLKWNMPSRQFYESIGAIAQDDSVGYRLSGQTLMDFAHN